MHSVDRHSQNDIVQIGYAYDAACVVCTIEETNQIGDYIFHSTHILHKQRAKSIAMPTYSNNNRPNRTQPDNNIHNNKQHTLSTNLFNIKYVRYHEN